MSAWESLTNVLALCNNFCYNDKWWLADATKGAILFDNWSWNTALWIIMIHDIVIQNHYCKIIIVSSVECGDLFLLLNIAVNPTIEIFMDISIHLHDVC
jgi:hypothetical protein